MTSFSTWKLSSENHLLEIIILFSLQPLRIFLSHFTYVQSLQTWPTHSLFPYYCHWGALITFLLLFLVCYCHWGLKQWNFRRENSAGIQILAFSKDRHLEYTWKNVLCIITYDYHVQSRFTYYQYIKCLMLTCTCTPPIVSSMHIYN